jgi:DNA-binding protein H-NS
MPTLEELIRQKAELEQAIERARADTRNSVPAEIRTLMSASGLALADLAPSRTAPKAPASRKPVAAKYRDEAGNTWSGRGLKPKWLSEALARGKSLKDFAI